MRNVFFINYSITIVITEKSIRNIEFSAFSAIDGFLPITGLDQLLEFHFSQVNGMLDRQGSIRWSSNHYISALHKVLADQVFFVIFPQNRHNHSMN